MVFINYILSHFWINLAYYVTSLDFGPLNVGPKAYFTNYVACWDIFLLNAAQI